MKQLSIYLLFLSLSGLSCQSFELAEPFKFSSKAETLAGHLHADTVSHYSTFYNLKYGKEPNQVYDLYLPARQDNRKDMQSVSLILVHGGGWALLDKSFLNPYVESFKKQGLNVTIFNINHRLADRNEINFPEIMDDFRTFFAHHDSLRDSLHLNNKKVLWGYSSGGHLALSYAYMYGYKNIDATVAIVAPTDLSDPKIHEHIYDDKGRNLCTYLIGQSFEEAPHEFRMASPINYVTKDTPPTLLIYGGSDFLVDQSQGQRLHEKLTKVKVHNHFELVPDATHDMDGKTHELIAQSVEFLNGL